MFVNVLLFIAVVRLTAATCIKIIAALAATVCPQLLKSLLLTFKILVVLAEPAGIAIPVIAPVARPLFKEMLLNVTLFVKVDAGTELDA